MMALKSKRESLAGTIFTGFLFLGMGAGFFTGFFLPGLFWGMGIGFIAAGIIRFTLLDDGVPPSFERGSHVATRRTTPEAAASPDSDFEDYLFEERDV